MNCEQWLNKQINTVNNELKNARFKNKILMFSGECQTYHHSPNIGEWKTNLASGTENPLAK